MKLNARRVELQKQQLVLELERAALETKVEAEMAAEQSRIEALAQSGHQGDAEDAAARPADGPTPRASRPSGSSRRNSRRSRPR